jgi:uncharacterized protein
MIVDLLTLAEGLTEFGFNIPTAHLSSDDTLPEFTRPVRCTVEVYRKGIQVVINGKFDAIVKLNCSRCLELSEHRVTAEFTSDFRPYSEIPAGEGDIELTPEELDITWYQNNELDLTDQVRQNILVNLPMQPLCNENCRGLCVQCGTNLNTGTCQCKNEDDENPFKKLSGLRLS